MIEYLLTDVLKLDDGHPLRIKLLENGYTTFDQFLALTPLEIASMNLRLADKSLLNIFLNFMISKIQESNQDIYSLPEDFWISISNLSFRKYRSDLIISPQPKTNSPHIEMDSANNVTPRYRNFQNFETPNPSSRNFTHRDNYRHSSLGTINSTQTIHPLMKKVQKVADFPQFNGHQREWKFFERTFLAVATTQNYGHVLQTNPLFVPLPEQEEEFKLDCNYIYQAFRVAWCKGSNYDIVDKHKNTCDGRQVYLDALDYYRSGAFTIVELQDAINDLVNNKLLPITHDGAAGYNSKFNEAVNTINHVGYTLDPKIVKCLYLANIQDSLYDTIKDR